MTNTRIQVTAALVSAALVLAVIFAVAPHTTVIANDVSGEIYGIGIAQLSPIVPADALDRRTAWSPLTGDGSN